MIKKGYTITFFCDCEQCRTEQEENDREFELVDGVSFKDCLEQFIKQNEMAKSPEERWKIVNAKSGDISKMKFYAPGHYKK